MSKALEEVLLDLLLQEGRISAGDLEKANDETAVPPRTEQETPWGEKVKRLIRRGVISEKDIAPLFEHLRAEGFATDNLSPSGLADLAAEAPPSLDPGDFPIKNWDRYDIRSVLGAGGMGTVYKAYDPRLKRFVALKVARGGEPRLKARFLREAQAQARLAHENVCRIYEAGEEQGVAFIAMQCIEGQTLHEAREEMTLEQKAIVIQGAALAVHEAHRLGIIHRDLKPGNIMVERTSGGAWKPFVLDFGLARDMASSDMTATGALMGTPSFLSPEQAAGKPLDRRSDIFSLGATLYYLLAGTPPFGETPMEALSQLALNEPAPLRRREPSVPRDLETVVMKCLEKEQGRRYDSARALAEDLGRFLDGEPVLARPPNLATRLAKKARKNKLLLGFAPASVLAAATGLAVGVKGRIEAREQVRIANQFDQRVRHMEDRLRYAYSTPSQNAGEVREKIKAETRAIESEIPALGSIALGPGHYALGRARLALGEEPEAEKRLLLAWDRYGYRAPQVAFALGLTLALKYRLELGKVESVPDKAAREARRKELEAATAREAVRYLELGKEAFADSPEYGLALVAFLQKRYETAAALARDSLQRFPWMYEAEILEGDAYSELGSSSRDRGGNAGALDWYAKAERAYEGASAAGVNDPAGFKRLALLETNIMALRTYQSGISPEEAYQKALKACDAAIALDPSSHESMATEAYACWRWGEYQLYRGQDPTKVLDRAILAGTKAVSLDPSDPFGLNELGTAYYIKGEWELGAGLDPRASLKRATETYEKTLRLNPQDFVALSNMGGAWGMLGQYGLGHGLDPGASLTKAVQYYEKVTAINPKNARAYSNMGNAYGIMGQLEMERGQDPSAPLTKAIACFQRAAALNPSHSSAYINLGLARLAMAKYERAVGAKPASQIEMAIQNCEEALKIKPDSIPALTGLAQGLQEKAERELERGADASTTERRAKSVIEKVLRAAPDNPDGFLLLGNLEFLEAKVKESRLGSPEAPLRGAERDLARSVQLQPQSPEPHLALEELYAWRAEWKRKGGKACEREIQKGLSEGKAALALDPVQAEAVALEGALRLSLARSSTNPAARKEAARQAAAAIGRAISMNPFLERRYKPLIEEARRLASAR